MEEKEGALGFATRAVHVGNDVDKDSGTIKRPIIMANSYALPYDPMDMNWSSAGANPFEEVERADDFKALSIMMDAPDGAQEVSYAIIGGVLFFGLNADHDTHNRLVSHLKVIPSAVSLGENDERQYLYPPEFHNGFFRFSVGIEDKEDILADLKQAMTKTGLEKVSKKRCLTDSRPDSAFFALPLTFPTFAPIMDPKGGSAGCIWRLSG